MGDKIGVVIGMGNLWDKDQACKTTIGGPEPFKTCKTPFLYKEPYFLCSKHQTPSSSIEVCRQFFEKVKTLYSRLVWFLFAG